MKTTIGQLRSIIKEVVTEAIGERPVSLGYLRADIVGDTRYTDTLRIDYASGTDTVSVSVSSGLPVGGMDSFTPSTASEQYRKEFSASDLKGIMMALKEVLSDTTFNFKRYGKPTKNLRWKDKSVGPSAANLKANIDAVKGNLT
jgi:hypothetical protein